MTHNGSRSSSLPPAADPESKISQEKPGVV
jgi:hypothetical protein